MSDRMLVSISEGSFNMLAKSSGTVRQIAEDYSKAGQPEIADVLGDVSAKLKEFSLSR